MKYCTKCGSQVSESDKFCSDCGMPNDQSSNSDTIKADLKVELVNTSTDKAFKAVSNSITEGKRVVKKAQELRVKNIQAFNVMCGTKRLEFEKSISNEKEMCVYKNYKTSTYLDYDETWNVVKNNCSLSYTELNKYKD